MKSDKKLVIGIIIAALIVMVISTVVILNNGPQKEIEQANEEEDNGISKLESLSEKMEKEKNYSVSLTLNGENSRTTSKKDDKTKIEINDEGEKNTYIVKDGTTYLLVDESKKYYEYKNNVSMLNDFENRTDEILTKHYTTGKEKIEGKEYKFEEFKNTSAYIINYKSDINDSDTKTRLYFDGNNLKYIKTYVGDVEQLLKVDMTFNNQNDSNFEIPNEYNK